jgi:copper chaperone CopZ
MSRRGIEFQHRTSIFEGAYRAWSHLGGLSLEELDSTPSSELDPLTHRNVGDSRVSSKGGAVNGDGSTRRDYPYEPLPRAGLSHSFVKAILSPWLGPDVEEDAVKLGLNTLRTWWQHRKKGENSQANKALGSEKMQKVVNDYTRHFFQIAHCLVVSDNEQPPKGLLMRMRKVEKVISKGHNEKITSRNLTPLETLQAAQLHQPSIDVCPTNAAPLNMKGKCLPGKIDLPGLVDGVSRRAMQITHIGGRHHPDKVPSSSSLASMSPTNESHPFAQFGDPHTVPVVYCSSSGDHQIAMKVDGITCAHCVKIVETVLRGCNGKKSPIDGLLDAAADRDLQSVLVRLDSPINAKRVAFEAARNLSLVGYKAEAIEMRIYSNSEDEYSDRNLSTMSRAFEDVANTNSNSWDIFDWKAPCICPDNGVYRGDCSR